VSRVISLSRGIGVMRSDFTSASPFLTSLHSRGVAKTTLHDSLLKESPDEQALPRTKHRTPALTTNTNVRHSMQSMRLDCMPSLLT
jgi:hypothetical protein